MWGLGMDSSSRPAMSGFFCSFFLVVLKSCVSLIYWVLVVRGLQSLGVGISLSPEAANPETDGGEIEKAVEELKN